MKIPKKIYQVWHDKNPKPVFQEYIQKMLNINPGYDYELFGEDDIDNFVNNNFDSDIRYCYSQLNIITAKVDFWRYLILYKNGGIYIDIDSTFLRPLDDLIKDNDDAIITREPNTPYEYVQWALFFCKNHPILEKTIQNVIFHIKNRLFENNVGRMTGPYPFTLAVDEFMKLSGSTIDRTNLSIWTKNDAEEQYPNVYCYLKEYNFRIYGVEYGKFALSWVPEKDSMYSNKNPHWSIEQQYKDILK